MLDKIHKDLFSILVDQLIDDYKSFSQLALSNQDVFQKCKEKIEGHERCIVLLHTDPSALMVDLDYFPNNNDDVCFVKACDLLLDIHIFKMGEHSNFDISARMAHFTPKDHFDTTFQKHFSESYCYAWFKEENTFIPYYQWLDIYRPEIEKQPIEWQCLASFDNRHRNCYIGIAQHPKTKQLLLLTLMMWGSSMGVKKFTMTIINGLQARLITTALEMIGTRTHEINRNVFSLSCVTPPDNFCPRFQS
jgi:hypothetical protein